MFFAKWLSKLISRFKKQCFTVVENCFQFKIDHKFGKYKVKYISR